VSPLTVLHVNTEQGFRGGEIQNLYLAAGLVDRGHRPILACQPGSELSSRAADRGLDVREGPMAGEFDLAAAAWLRRLMRQERPHVVHYHSSHAVTLGTLARWSRGRPPAVVTRRTSSPTKRNPLFRLKFGFRIDAVIAVSGSIRDDLAAAGLPEAKLAVVHSGIDLGRYERIDGVGEFRREIQVAPDDLLIGCIGALTPQKGHRLLLRALARLAPEFPNLHAAIVGGGDLMGDLLAEARGLGIGDRAHLTGFRDDVPRVIPDFDLAVLPSVGGEGSPAAIKEAMACGIPIVASRTGGVPEILQDGIQGLLVPPGDEAALAAALRRLLQDPDLRSRLGAAGRERVREFSMERMIEKTEAVYLRVCGPGSAGRG
jgi:glycosyltransferase involved in cell wall biosynthesis